jgi:hypothetical protein|tara:strand:- start:188 stop:520 length:333 start_codon:yes stop_codon:yes gene_type:complete
MFTTLNTNNLSKKSITIFLGILIIFLSGCQTIKKKSDEVAEKENEKFGQFVGKEVNEMRLELGTPTEDYVNELGNEMLVYKTKKYGIPCERKFEVNTSGVIIGFSSSGCI